MANVQDTVTGHKLFEKMIKVPGINRFNSVFASITEIDTQGVPGMGLATLAINQVVPIDNAVIVRGFIEWDSDLMVRISVLAP
ncbi:hypothetical protein [Nocardia sp. NPDC059228]|uniref:hypothetical protein n=1 Tax=Nocardia sp. NPDC059228 TaxID=3346777 RepID=UPI0036AAF0E4